MKAIRDLRHLQGGLVFPRPDRERPEPYSLDQLHERLWGACRRAGVREVTWKDLRHTYRDDALRPPPGSGDAIRVLDTGHNGPPVDRETSGKTGSVASPDEASRNVTVPSLGTVTETAFKALEEAIRTGDTVRALELAVLLRGAMSVGRSSG